MRGEPWLLSFEEGFLPVMTWHILLGQLSPPFPLSMSLVSCLIELLPYGGRIVYDMSELLLCKSKEPQENKEKTQKTFMYLPQREKDKECVRQSCVCCERQKRIKWTVERIWKKPQSKMRSSLARFHRVFKSKATWHSSLLVGQKNVIKAQLELGQDGYHILPLPPLLFSVSLSLISFILRTFFAASCAIQMPANVL